MGIHLHKSVCMKRNHAAHGKAVHLAWWTLLATVIGVTAAIRIRLLDLPLERDEGEYAYAGQLMLQGIAPYKLAYNMKFPGTYAAYALIMRLFGQTTTGIHLGLLIVTIATAALVFFLARRLTNDTAGIAAAACYAILSISPMVLGLAAHATHFVVLSMLGGALLLLYPSNQHPIRRLLASGALFGMALLMKQPAIFFIVFGAAYLFYRDYRAGLGWRQLLLRNTAFSCGAGVPLATTCLLLWWAGVFDKFWFWTIDYAWRYGGLISLSQAPQIFIKRMLMVTNFGSALWVMAGIGLIVCLWDRKTRARTDFIIGLLAFSALALCPGFYFREHYFILVLPAISILAGAAMAKADEICISITRSGVVRSVPLLLFAAVLAFPLNKERQLFFALSPSAACQTIYGWWNPFPESVKIAEYLRQNTSSDDSIVVLGSEPQIYFYSNRHSATGYIYTYGLMEPQKYALQMQREMIHEIEVARPKYLVVLSVDTSWLIQPASDHMIFDWAKAYHAGNFTVVGLVNIVSAGRTDYYLPYRSESVELSRNHVTIYQRNSNPW